MKNVKTERIMSGVSFGSFAPGWSYKPYNGIKPAPTYSAIIDHPHRFSPAETDGGESGSSEGCNADFSGCNGSQSCMQEVLDNTEGCEGYTAVGTQASASSSDFGYSEGWGGSDVPW